MSFLQHYKNMAYEPCFPGDYALCHELDLLESGQHAIQTDVCKYG